tara:strand:- start:69 stop:287 length:219 start_codon:yes stop_codon:yes gene_type:complete
MLEQIKLTLLTWGIIFMMILMFITFSLWCFVSIWWLITNNMIDRNMFILLTTSSSFILSLLLVLAGALSKEK